MTTASQLYFGNWKEVNWTYVVEIVIVLYSQLSSCGKTKILWCRIRHFSSGSTIYNYKTQTYSETKKYVFHSQISLAISNRNALRTWSSKFAQLLTLMSSKSSKLLIPIAGKIHQMSTNPMIICNFLYAFWVEFIGRGKRCPCKKHTSKMAGKMCDNIICKRFWMLTCSLSLWFCSKKARFPALIIIWRWLIYRSTKVNIISDRLLCFTMVDDRVWAMSHWHSWCYQDPKCELHTTLWRSTNLVEKSSLNSIAIFYSW